MSSRRLGDFLSALESSSSPLPSVMAEVQIQQDEEVPESEVLPFLPDDVLVKIFEYLSRKELFSVRVVCRRWADVALHPDLWRRQKVTLSSAKPNFCYAALRLLPYATSLTLYRVKPPEDYRQLLGSTPCALNELRLMIFRRNAFAAALALKRQATLGRLKRVEIFDAEDVSLGAFYRALFSTGGLTELALCGLESERLKWLPAGRLVPPSLKKLTFLSKEARPSRFAIFRHLVDGHASTLEVVHLQNDMGAHYYPSAPSAEWLANVTGLRELVAPPDMRDMLTLRECGNLESLTLSPRITLDFAQATGIREYLRQANQLKTLKFESPGLSHYEDAKSNALQFNLVQDLASTCLPALEVLSLDFVRREIESLPVLLSALPKLGALRELRAWAESDVTLRLLTCLSAMRRPYLSSAPALTLNVGGYHPGGPDVCCWHGWLHRHQRQIRAFFEANPALHLKIKRWSCSTSHDCGGVPAVGGDCRFKHTAAHLVLFGHADIDVCDLPHDADPCTAYRRVA